MPQEPDYVVEENGCQLEIIADPFGVRVMFQGEKVGAANGPWALVEAKKIAADKDAILARRKAWREKQANTPKP